MTRKLRVLTLIIQPQLVWDDGELTPGPALEPKSLPVSQIQGFLDSLPAQLERLEREES